MPSQSFQNSQTLGQFFEPLYNCGILHHDISPGNILITSDKRFDGGLLIDWDLSKDINSQMDEPHHAACIVSIRYLPICWVFMNWT